MKEVIFFGWPSPVGGADTKLAHLLRLLHRDLKITCVPRWPEAITDPKSEWIPYLKALGIKYCQINELPDKLDGIAVALCNPDFFAKKICHKARDMGMKIVWSSEMMWMHEGEKEAIQQGLVDRLLYVSDVQKKALNYESFSKTPTYMTGNYIDIADFPYNPHQGRFTIGRLSRPDPAKYPEDFPIFYESLQIPNAKYRVMAWDEQLTEKYKYHYFGEQWQLLKANEEPTLGFLHSLDLFVYPLGHTFIESWGRAVVESMLCGCIPLVPPGHHIDNLVKDGVAGFICRDFMDYKSIANEIYHSPDLKAQLSLQARKHAETLCNPEEHRKLWLEALNV